MSQPITKLISHPISRRQTRHGQPDMSHTTIGNVFKNLNDLCHTRHQWPILQSVK